MVSLTKDLPEAVMTELASKVDQAGWYDLFAKCGRASPSPPGCL